MIDQVAFPAGSEVGDERDFSRKARTTAFCAFAILILFGPFVAQVLGVRHGLLRPWSMFSAVGVGILNGEFEAIGSDGAVKRLSPLQVFGADRYPAMLSTQFPLRVEKPQDLRKFAEAYCAKHDVKLSFTGRVGGRRGWQDLRGEDICGRSVHARN